ncbi:hypothetical protein ACFQY7_28125 [Actinomadura luteofluorescens]
MDDVVRAIADPVRREILVMLRGGGSRRGRSPDASRSAGRR